MNDPEALNNYDAATSQFQTRHKFSDKKGKLRFKSSFSGTNTFDRATELGKEWVDEYRTIYQLGSLQVHGAPGAVLHTVFMSHYPDAEFREKNMIALTSLMATKVMVRNVELLTKTGIILDSSLVMNAMQKFTKKLAKSLSQKTAARKRKSEKKNAI